MPDDRLIHRRIEKSQKVSRLTDFEYRVWTAYLLAADDFGVMLDHPMALQTRNDAMAARKAAVVRRGLERLLEIGLIQRFTHEGRAYVFQGDWQDWQKIIYPRATMLPRPLGALCSRHTQWLLSFHPRGAKMGKWQAPDAFLSQANAYDRDASRNDTEKPPENHSGKHSEKPSGNDSENLSGKASGNALAVSRLPLAVSRGETREARPTRAAATGGGVMAGTLPREHLRHAWCGRVCVPDFLHAELAGKLTGDPSQLDAAAQQLRAWYQATLDAIPLTQPIGDEPIAFWRQHFRAWQPSAAPRGRNLAAEDDAVWAKSRELGLPEWEIGR